MEVSAIPKIMATMRKTVFAGTILRQEQIEKIVKPKELTIIIFQ